jgi:hypothetical protein
MARTRRGSAAIASLGHLKGIMDSHPNLKSDLDKKREMSAKEGEEKEKNRVESPPPPKRRPGRPRKSESQPKPPVAQPTPRRTASQQLRDAEISCSPGGSKMWSNGREDAEAEEEPERDYEAEHARWKGSKE